ncbi:MAG: SRPBCC domain-containing protein [Bacteroidota bacterium]
MERLQFTAEIKAPAKEVYNAMLGLEDIKTYEEWTAAFNPTSSYEGSWDKGSKMYFIGVDEDGKRGGMISEIVENKPAVFVSIRHYGILNGDTEITSGEEVEKWGGGFENYAFSEQNGQTTLTVDVDVTEEYIDFFRDVYPRALQVLKEQVEKP